MPDFDKLMAYVLKLSFASFVLVVAADLVSEILSQLSFTALILTFLGFALISPIAYFIRESARPHARSRSRQGAERTPLLPPHEED